MKFKHLLASLISSSAILAVAALGGVAHAATVFTSQAAFNAATSAPGVDTFGNFDTTGSPITRSAGAYSYSAAVDIAGFFAAGTTANTWLSTYNAIASITFSGFAPTISGIGALFFGSDVSGNFLLGDIALSLVDSSGVTSFTIIGATTSSFVGFVSDGAITSLTISAIQSSPPPYLWPTVDNLTLAQGLTSPVPEPSTWAMMILGFAGVGYMAYRRRKVAALAA